MRISDWSSDVCSSDRGEARQPRADEAPEAAGERSGAEGPPVAGAPRAAGEDLGGMGEAVEAIGDEGLELQQDGIAGQHDIAEAGARSERRRVGKESVSTCMYRWAHCH